MNKKSSVIEIDGKLYDALTGQIVGAVKKVVTRASKPAPGLAIDGFVKRKTDNSTKKAILAKKILKPTTGHEQQAKTLSQRLKTTKKNIHRNAQRPKTLMRSIVSKPSGIQQATKVLTGRKGRVIAIDATRAARAKAIPKDEKVRHFGFSTTSTPSKKTEKKVSVGEVLPKQMVAAHNTASATTTVARPLPSLITSVSHRQLERLLDHALANADAHREALKSQLQGSGLWQRITRVPKWLSIGALVLVIFLAGGFFVWQNMPNVAVRIAALRAHVSASAPSYTPTGFKFAGLADYHNGAVTIKYKASGDASRTFSITQEKSILDSASLIATETSANTPQSSQVNGKTVYIYGNDNDAVWVDHGIKYFIDDHANLNADQILKIAGSLN